jgi:hypothetical protein
VWAGWRNDEGELQDMQHARFFHRFGVDVLTAQTLGATEAEELRGRVQAHMDQNNVPPATYGNEN